MRNSQLTELIIPASGFPHIQAVFAHLPAVAFFGAASHGAALAVGLLLYFQGALYFMCLF